MTTTLRKAHSRFDYNIVSRDILKIIFDDCLGARSRHNNIIINDINYNTTVYNIYNLHFTFIHLVKFM